MALTDKLTSIADGFRSSRGTTDKYTLEQMAVLAAEPVGGGGADLPEEAFVISGNCDYRFAKDGWNWFVENYGNRVTTKNVSGMDNMFAYTYELKDIPFDINCLPLSGSSNHIVNYMFTYSSITELPRIYNCRPQGMTDVFTACKYIREIPEDYFDTWDFSYISGQTSAYGAPMRNIYKDCYSLRKAPVSYLKNCNPNITYSYSIYGALFSNCYVFNEIIDLPVSLVKWDNNAFSGTFNNCNRVKWLTFETNEDGSPITVEWKNQTIELSTLFGYAGQESNIISYNSGINTDKKIYTDETYAALKNDPDAYATRIEYSRYNHDSAVATINSLPDASDYLASAGGTNTIKFYSNAGSKTDGGAINTLTAEEIAVAAAKGWTVTMI